MTSPSDVVALLKSSRGVELELRDVPRDDAGTFELLQSGHTIGVRQFELGGMRDLLQRVRPSRISELAIMVALYRPAPMEAGLLKQLIEQSSTKIAGEETDQLWADLRGPEIDPHLRRDATEQARQGYLSAYLKCHYPIEFMAAALSAVTSGPRASAMDKLQQYARECRRLGIVLLGPDVGRSDTQFSVEGQCIRCGLDALHLPAQLTDSLRAEFRGDPSSDFDDFCRRMLLYGIERRHTETLIKAGAFDSWNKNRADLMARLDEFERAGRSTDSGTAPWAAGERLAYERAILGFYVSGHPLEEVPKSELDQWSHTIAQAKNEQHGARVRVGGVVADLQVRSVLSPNPRSGLSEYAMFELEDEQDRLRCLAWPEVLDQVRDTLANDRVLMVSGTVSAHPGSDEGALVVDELASCSTAS